jgi:hypothetical protein
VQRDGRWQNITSRRQAEIAYLYERNRERSKYVSLTLGIYWLVGNKDRTIGSQTPHTRCHLCIGKTEVEQFVQTLNHESSIRTSATKPCSRRDILCKADRHRRYVHILGTEHIQYAYNKIIMSRAIQFTSVYNEGVFASRRYLQTIGKGNRQEDRFDVVITVTSSGNYIQAKVNLAVRISNHFCLYLV